MCCMLVVGSVLELFYCHSMSIHLNKRHKNVYFSMTYIAHENVNVVGLLMFYEGTTVV